MVLEELAQACDIATFGVNQQDTLDESYRKAGKLDSQYFAPKFDLQRSGLVGLIQDDLLEGPRASNEIRAELYKLNVYGRTLSHSRQYSRSNFNLYRPWIVLQGPQGHTTK